MKKKLVLFVVLVLGIFMLASCSNGNEISPATNTQTIPSTVTPTTGVPTTVPTTVVPTPVPTEVKPDLSEYLEYEFVRLVFMYGSAFFTYNVVNHTDKAISHVKNYSFIAYNDANEVIYQKDYLYCYFMDLGPKGTEEHLAAIEDDEIVSMIKSFGTTYSNFKITFDEIVYK